MDHALAPIALAAERPPAARRAVAVWLLVCAALVVAMVLVGGVTRLTRSGLSIVEWQPVVGIIPPLTADDWRDAFAKYQQTPEYQRVNHGMSLAGFKGIFWWEYVHRLLGRLIAVAFLAPLAWFWWRGQIDRLLGGKLIGLFALGGLQGALGWYMVASGLIDEPRVSHFRLAAHLGLAFLILGALLWLALDLLWPRGHATTRRPSRHTPLAGVVVGLIFVQALAGGLVAGIRAGKAYNTFPLMDGYLVPPEAWALDPWWRNVFYNMATVQLDHRLLAWTLLGLGTWLWWRVQRGSTTPPVRLGVHLLCALIIAQFALGVATVLAGVPVALGAAHQAVATLVFAAALFTLHTLRRDHTVAS